MPMVHTLENKNIYGSQKYSYGLVFTKKKKKGYVK